MQKKKYVVSRTKAIRRLLARTSTRHVHTVRGHYGDTPRAMSTKTAERRTKTQNKIENTRKVHNNKLSIRKLPFCAGMRSPFLRRFSLSRSVSPLMLLGHDRRCTSQGRLTPLVDKQQYDHCNLLLSTATDVSIPKQALKLRGSANALPAREGIRFKKKKKRKDTE